jgi:acetylglutamate kinase
MDLPPASSLSITRADEMTKELFTHRGSGTLVRRGERILTYTSWKKLDLARFRALIESSFGRPLTRDYFETTKPLRIYCSEHYRAGIVLIRDRDLVYMDKFVVSDDAQGEGLGRAIWQVMRGENDQLFWRSRRGNAINEFYFANCDGAIKDERWTVFWYGLSDFDTIGSAIDQARSRPVSV